MIKQINKNFELVKYTATINGNATLVDSKEDFERQLREMETLNAEIEAMKQGLPFDRDSFEPTLPPIEYTENTLTEEQQERLDYINEFETITLDEAREYVVNNVEPTSNTEYQLSVKDKQIDDLNSLVGELLMQIVEIKMGGELFWCGIKL